MTDVLFGKGNIKEILEVLFWMDFTILVLLGYISWTARRLLKDNGIIAAMLKRISGDLPN